MSFYLFDYRKKTVLDLCFIRCQRFYQHLVSSSNIHFPPNHCVTVAVWEETCILETLIGLKHVTWTCHVMGSNPWSWPCQGRLTEHACCFSPAASDSYSHLWGHFQVQLRFSNAGITSALYICCLFLILHFLFGWLTDFLSLDIMGTSHPTFTRSLFVLWIRLLYMCTRPSDAPKAPQHYFPH